MTGREMPAMNVQIFGTKKSSDTRKAERWFKERRIKAQFIDLMDKGISRGELRSVAQAAGGLDALLDGDCRDRDALALVRYTAAAQRGTPSWSTRRCCARRSCATAGGPPWATAPRSTPGGRRRKSRIGIKKSRPPAKPVV